MSEPQHPPVPSNTPPQQPAAPSTPSAPADHTLPANPQQPSPGSYPPAASSPANPGYPPAGQPGADPYGTQPGYGAPTPASATASGWANTNPLARIAFIIALAGLGLRLLSALIVPFISIGGGYETFGLVSGLLNFLVFGASVAALVLGLLSIRRGGPLLLAGIAVGVAGAQVLQVAIGWMSSLFYYI
jgi:hypothetical protein